MRTLDICLYVVAVGLFVLSALSFIPDAIRVRLIGAGLVAAFLVPPISLIQS